MRKLTLLTLVSSLLGGYPQGANAFIMTERGNGWAEAISESIHEVFCQSSDEQLAKLLEEDSKERAFRGEVLVDRNTYIDFVNGFAPNILDSSKDLIRLQSISIEELRKLNKQIEFTLKMRDVNEMWRGVLANRSLFYCSIAVNIKEVIRAKGCSKSKATRSNLMKNIATCSKIINEIQKL